MQDTRLDGEALEQYLENKYGENYKEKLKPNDEDLKENYFALLWWMKNGEDTTEDILQENGKTKKKIVKKGASVEDALRRFDLKIYEYNEDDLTLR